MGEPALEFAVDPSVVWWTIALITLPGFLLGWLSGLRVAWAVVASVPLSFSLYGLAGWLLGLTPQAFGPGSVTVVFFLALMLALVWRVISWQIRARRHSPTPPAIFSRDVVTAHLREEISALRTAALPGVAVLAIAALTIHASLGWLEASPWGMRNIIQGWDSQWHANAVRWILDEGVASPTRMGELQNPESQRTVYYPAAFHATAALAATLSGAHPIAALNALTVVAPALALPVSVALMAWLMVGNKGIIGQIAAPLGALISVGIPALLWIGNYVGFYPYMTAMAIGGIVAALFMSVPARPVMAFSAALALTGVTQLHPAAVTTPVLMVGLWWLLHLVWKPARPATQPGTWPKVRTRLRDLAWLAATGVAGVIVLLPQILVGSEQAEEVAGWSTPDGTDRAQAWVNAVTMTTRHVLEFAPDWDATVLLWLAAAGGLVVLLWFRNVWAPVFYALSLVITVHVLNQFEFPGVELLSLISGLHYNTAHRLIWPVAMMTSAAAGIAIATIVRLITGGPMAALVDEPQQNEESQQQRRRTWQRATSLAAIIVAVPVFLGMGWFVRSEAGPSAREAYQMARTSTRMVSSEDLQAWDWLAQQPKAYDGFIAGEAADGMGWMYAYNGLPALHRHYQWPSNPRDASTELLFWNANLLGEGIRGDADALNPVDEAAADLGVNYFYLSPPSFWAFQYPQPALTMGLWNAPGTTLVYQDGGLAIFAVDAAFTDDELAQVMESGERHSPDPVAPLSPAP